VRYTALFQSLGSLELPKTQVETVETSRWADDDNTTRSIDETDCNLAFIGEMAVCLFDVFADDAN
jgi:hypothetical protein